ncbi:MAG TPA: acyl-CoA dehydrogenase family protein [Streptosporangiaceae bacterium]|nr:acyl-CoA dehydrogenase family protein [Streptosporangiaceae bacterium]
MELVVTAEQEELRSALRRFFAGTSSSAQVRRLMETTIGYDPGVWTQMGDQLGLQGLAIPEEYGGSGFGFRELVIVLEEMGRVLLCAPYLASAVLAAGALLHGGDEVAKQELLPGIASGETIATLAWTEENGRWDASGVTMVARRQPAFEEHPVVWTLDGTKTYVLDGHVAGLVLVVARTPGGLSLFAVDGGVAGLTRTLLPTFDQTRKLARIDFDSVPARLIGAEGSAAGMLAATLDRAAVALAAEQLGGAQRVLELSVEYAKLRHQFGRPIGGFQAIKHRLADMYIELQCAEVAAAAAAEALDSGIDVAASVHTAKSVTGRAAAWITSQAQQVHGGIGFTWEHVLHLYLRRAKANELLLGSPAAHEVQLVAALSGNR